MNKKNSALILIGIAAILNFVNVAVVNVLVVLLLGGALWLLFSATDDSKSEGSSTEELTEKTFTTSEAESVVRNDEKDNATIVLTGKHISSQWLEFENNISTILHQILLLAQEQFKPHTVALFMPDANGAYRLRSHISQSNSFVADAMVVPGEGFLGTYCKEGFPELILDDVAGRKLPHYGEKNGGVNSLMIAPVGAVKASAFILVDSTEKSAFKKENLDWLVDLGSLAGQLLYYSYLYKQHQLLHEQVNAIAQLEKKLLMIENKDELLNELSLTISHLFSFVRSTISIVPDEHDRLGVIQKIIGECDGMVEGDKFELVEGSLVHMSFYNQQPLARNVNSQNDFLFSEKDCRSKNRNSFAVLPLGRMNGLVVLESDQTDIYTPAMMNTLSRIVMVAGVALDKIRVLEQQENLAIRDGLTGLYNHRQFQHLLREAIARSHRMVLKSVEGGDDSSHYEHREEKRPVSLVLCDIDHFKKFNDTYGHRFGDEVLREIAATLDKGVREGVDCACRYGGEEFSMVLFDSDGTQAVETANRIRQKIEALTFKSPAGEMVKVTMSFGVAVYDKDASQQEDLIRKADKALYRAKEKGRNRVEQFGV